MGFGFEREFENIRSTTSRAWQPPISSFLVFRLPLGGAITLTIIELKTMAPTVAVLDSPPSLCRVYGSVVCSDSAESLPSLWLGLCAWALPSLRRVSGAIRSRDFLIRSRRARQPAITSFLESELDPPVPPHHRSLEDESHRDNRN